MAGAGTYPYHHQQWPPSTAPQPPVHSPAPPAPGAPPPAPPPSLSHHPPFLADNPNNRQLSNDEIRTIFIAGLPEDVKERELQNLLRWFPGYEASQVTVKGEHPMGFALFSTPHYAVSARDTLQDLVFDVDAKSVLHTEMAKKNLFFKRADTNSYDQSKRLRTGGDYTNSGYSSPSPFHAPPPPVWGSHGYMNQAPQPYDPYSGYPMAAVPMPAPTPIPAPSSYVPVQSTRL
uniref:RRM domain-containing protein n=1 Tax=Kalanchoe fedtschenkoi TaxID=63787 RepID=A0A7N0RGT8_KALFE